MNILKIRTNTVTNENYDEFGNYFRRGNPKISIGSTFRLEWYLYTDTTDANNSGVNVSEWVTDKTLSGYSAILTCDADWVHRVSGIMETDGINAGDLFPEQITVNISGAAGKNIASSGKMTLYNSQGMFQTILYSSREINGSSVVFSLGAGLHAEYSFSAGDSVTVSQEAYFEAASIADESDPGNGKFVFDVVVRSRKLQEVSDTMTSGSLKIQGLELLPFTTDSSGNYIQSPAYLLDSAILVSTLGDPVADAEIGDPVKSEIGALIDQKIANIPDVTAENSGLMSASDKAKLDSLENYAKNKGHFSTETALKEAYPTAEAGDYATVEETDSLWLWDSDTSTWVDSGSGGGGGGGGGSGTASETTITDEGGYFTADTVEGALQELGATLGTIETTLAEI